MKNLQSKDWENNKTIMTQNQRNLNAMQENTHIRQIKDEQHPHVRLLRKLNLENTTNKYPEYLFIVP